jgi:hypothetical protein
MSTLLQLMDLFPVTDYLLLDTISSMFSFTTLAFSENKTKTRVRRHETPVDTRPNPPQLADPAIYL